MATQQRTVVTADGVEIAYDVTGQGRPALMFVHGWAGRRAHWDEQVEHFAGEHTVVRLDLAGHGASARNRQRWTVSAFADDVVSVADALGIDSVILIGHSLGGSVIVEAADRLQGRVAGLIGVDTWSSLGVRAPAEVIEASVLLPEMRADFPSGARQFARLMCGPSTDADLTARIVSETTGMAPEIAIAILDEAIRKGPDDIERILKTIDVPRWAVSSETFRPKDPDVLAAFGIRSSVLPGTGHYLMLEQPAAFNRLLAEAIARATSSDTNEGRRPSRPVT